MPLSATFPLLQAVFHEGIIGMRATLWGIRLKPCPQFRAKGFIFGAIVKIHDSPSCGCSLLQFSAGTAPYPEQTPRACATVRSAPGPAEIRPPAPHAE